MVERGVRWNIHTDTGEQVRQRHRHLFAVINTQSKIDEIKEKIFRELSVAGDFSPICDYSIFGSNGLHCRVFSLSSDVGRIAHPERIYDNSNQFRRDRDLIPRTEEDMLAYVERNYIKVLADKG
jgi:hypothetical protein